MDFTIRHGLPFLLPNKAQKHVTLNEALQVLDLMTGLSVRSRSMPDQPAMPAEGDAYILPVDATDVAWATYPENSIVAFLDGAWSLLTTPDGCRAWIADETTLCILTSGTWTPLSPDVFPVLGVNTDADPSTRLAVKSVAVLFSHDDVTPGSGDMRHAINRETPGNTGSVLLQTDHYGGSELGLIGTDDFEIKLSPDGSAWTTGLRLAAADGRISLPAGFADPAGVLGSLGLQYPLGTIADDDTGTADFGDFVYGSAILAIPNSLTSGPVAFFFARMATTPALTTMFSTGAAFTVQTGELTGTTGEDGKINFSATDEGRLTVENRRGYGVAYTLYAFTR